MQISSSPGCGGRHGDGAAGSDWLRGGGWRMFSPLQKKKMGMGGRGAKKWGGGGGTKWGRGGCPPPIMVTSGMEGGGCGGVCRFGFNRGGPSALCPPPPVLQCGAAIGMSHCGGASGPGEGQSGDIGGGGGGSWGRGRALGRSMLCAPPDMHSTAMGQCTWGGGTWPPILSLLCTLPPLLVNPPFPTGLLLTP